MSKILVTGVSGFVGKHLIKELSDNGYDVIGVGGKNSANSQPPQNLSQYLELDLTSAEETKQIDFTDIYSIIHLAGLAAVGPSFNDPKLYMNVNVGIQVNLFEEALKQDVKPKVLIISSGSIYDPKAELPLTETSRIAPNSPYAVSKLGQEQMAEYYGSRGFEYIIARPFNHIGPGQGQGFIVPDLANQIAEDKHEVLVGNLDAKRDYTDVRDIVRAYRLLLENGNTGEIYNVCSGQSCSGHEILDGLIKASGKRVSIRKDPSKMRPSDTPIIVGSREKITRDTGWQPEISLEQTLTDVINA